MMMNNRTVLVEVCVLRSIHLILKTDERAKTEITVFDVYCGIAPIRAVVKIIAIKI